MKKFLLILALALPLGACDLQTLQQDVRYATTGVPNPVTKDMLYQVENGMIVAIAGLNAYKKVCVSGAIPASCKDTIRTIQGYTRQVRKPDGSGLLADLRGFVKNNDQINANIVYNTIVDLMSKARAIALANNVQLGS